MDEDGPAFRSAVVDAVREGRILDAIKEFRASTGYSLKESKAFVEGMIEAARATKHENMPDFIMLTSRLAGGPVFIKRDTVIAVMSDSKATNKASLVMADGTHISVLETTDDVMMAISGKQEEA